MRITNGQKWFKTRPNGQKLRFCILKKLGTDKLILDNGGVRKFAESTLERFCLVYGFSFSPSGDSLLALFL